MRHIGANFGEYSAFLGFEARPASCEVKSRALEKVAVSTKNTSEVWDFIEAKREAFFALSDRIWDMPELNFEEHRSCAEHTAMLQQQGFRLTRGVADIPTAVMGEAGEGEPV